MPNAIVFDTLANAKRLQAVGFTAEQAEAQTRMVAELVDEQLITRSFLDERLKELEYRIVTRLGALIVIGFSIMGVLIKVL